MTTSTPDTHVADAINRVLEAEQATAAAIVEAQAAAQGVIEAAREQRRTILETARQRIVRMHERAQVRLETRLGVLDAEAADQESSESSSLSVADRAIARLAERLTTQGAA